VGRNWLLLVFAFEVIYNFKDIFDYLKNRDVYFSRVRSHAKMAMDAIYEGNLHELKRHPLL